MTWTTTKGGTVDAITGERLYDGSRVFDTGVKNKRVPFDYSRNKVVKEETIVWLAEQAGFTIVRGDEGDSGDSTVVDSGDVEFGDGEDSSGASSSGGRKASNRRAGGKAKG